MVDVAKSFEAPIKIVFPKDLAAASDFTLLGLGDIVLPGYVVCSKSSSGGTSLGGGDLH